jgi:hypothetical protein
LIGFSYCLPGLLSSVFVGLKLGLRPPLKSVAVVGDGLRRKLG